MYLQGEDRLYLNLGQTREFSEVGGEDVVGAAAGASSTAATRGNISLSLMSSGSKHWTAINIPHTYMGNSWPIRVRRMFVWHDKCSLFINAGALCNYVYVCTGCTTHVNTEQEEIWHFYTNVEPENVYFIICRKYAPTTYATYAREVALKKEVGQITFYCTFYYTFIILLQCTFNATLYF